MRPVSILKGHAPIEIAPIEILRDPYHKHRKTIPLRPFVVCRPGLTMRILPHVFSLFIWVSCLLPAASVVGQGIYGTVSAGDSGIPLVGAAVHVPSQGIGTTTGGGGTYSLALRQSGSISVVFSFTGFKRQEVTVTVGTDAQIEVSIVLMAGIELDPIQITAGRREERVLEAPSSMDIVTAADLRVHPSPSAVAALKAVTGVDMSQTGVDRYEVALRGFNEAFTGAAYVMTDYRHAAVPSFGTNIHGILPGLDIDLDRIEVVRGPGSALYGAGVSNGVIHYLSKGPFNDPGVTIAVRGGQQSLRDIRARAATTYAGRIGVKVAAAFTSAEDFAQEACEPDIVQDGDFNDCPDIHDARQIALEGVRETDYRKVVAYSTVEYKMGPGRSATIGVGESWYTGVLLSPIGTIQAKRYRYRYAQVRLDLGDFFFQAYTNRNDAGDTFLYSSSRRSPIVEQSIVYSLQAHYDGIFAEGRYKVSLGSDVDLTRPETKGGILGRFDDVANLNEIGVYAQATTRVAGPLDIVAASRADFNNAVGKVQLSPRAAMVYYPSKEHTLRLSFNRSFFTPNANMAFIDLEATEVPGTGIVVRARGAVDGFTWSRDQDYLALGAPTDLVASSLLPSQLGALVPVGIDTGLFYGLLYDGLLEIPTSEIVRQLVDLGIPVTEALATTLLQMLHPESLNVSGFSPGRLALYNITTRDVESYPEDLIDISPLRQTVSHTYEVGYKGLWGKRALVTIDAYYARRKHFTGPLRLETPLVVVPSLADDLIRDLAAGFEGNAVLASTLRAIGQDPAEVASLLVMLASDLGAIPAADLPIAIVQPSSNNQDVGNTPELMMTFRTFGAISYFGLDASAHVVVHPRFQLYGNMSVVSDDYFDHRELGEDDPVMALALNAPTFKLKAGGRYEFSTGMSARIALRYSRGFPVYSGLYAGDLEGYWVMDAGVGYMLSHHLNIDIGVSNVLDNRHREFIGAPKLGRLAIARMTYDVDFRR